MVDSGRVVEVVLLEVVVVTAVVVLVAVAVEDVDRSTAASVLGDAFDLASELHADSATNASATQPARRAVITERGAFRRRRCRAAR